MSTAVRPENTAPARGPAHTSAATPATRVSAEQSAKLAEALYQQAFSVMQTPVDASANAPVAQEEQLPKFAALFDDFIAGKTPDGKVARDFSRSSELASDFDSSSFMGNPKDLPNALQATGGKISDAYFAMLSKKFGPQSKDALEQTQLGQWLLGPRHADLQRVAAHLGPAIRASFMSKPGSVGEAQTLATESQTQIPSFVRALPKNMITSSTDIDTLVNLVLSEVGEDADKDLRLELKEVSAVNAHKSALRQYQQSLAEEESAAKKLGTDEYNQLRGAGAVSCTLEVYLAQRPIDMMMPSLTQDATSGQWQVKPGTVALAQPSWINDPNLIPIAMRPQPAVGSDEAFAQMYGLSTDAIHALRLAQIAAGGCGVTFDQFLSGNLHLVPGKTEAEAEANRKAAQANLSTALGLTKAPTGALAHALGDSITEKAHGAILMAGTSSPEPSPVAPPVKPVVVKSQTSIKAVTSSPALAIAAGAAKNAGAEADNVKATQDAATAAAQALGSSKPPKDFIVAAPETQAGQTMDVFETAVSGAKNDLDSLNDISTQKQMRLQMLMESRSKAYETLSNVMKASASTAQGLVDNLKVG